MYLSTHPKIVPFLALAATLALAGSPAAAQTATVVADASVSFQATDHLTVEVKGSHSATVSTGDPSAIGNFTFSMFGRNWESGFLGSLQSQCDAASSYSSEPNPNCSTSWVYTCSDSNDSITAKVQTDGTLQGLETETDTDIASGTGTCIPPTGTGGDPIREGPNGGSPVVVNLGHGPFLFTGLDDPVDFDIDRDGVKETISWTERGAEIAFLVLDRNDNGEIDDGGELFGNFTDQLDSPDPNGFLALAVFDLLEMGGNRDGRISDDDEIFNDLRLWSDWNHDGVSQPHELQPLAEADVMAIELDYVTANRRDRHGNRLRWTSRVHFEDRSRLAATDVIFLGELDPAAP